MGVLPTIEDFPFNKRNCGNCTRKSGVCPRNKKKYPNGYVMNSATGEIGGIIYCCPDYTGPFEIKPSVSVQLDLFDV